MLDEIACHDQRIQLVMQMSLQKQCLNWNSWSPQGFSMLWYICWWILQEFSRTISFQAFNFWFIQAIHSFTSRATHWMFQQYKVLSVQWHCISCKAKLQVVLMRMKHETGRNCTVSWIPLKTWRLIRSTVPSPTPRETLCQRRAKRNPGKYKSTLFYGHLIKADTSLRWTVGADCISLGIFE